MLVGMIGPYTGLSMGGGITPGTSYGGVTTKTSSDGITAGTPYGDVVAGAPFGSVVAAPTVARHNNTRPLPPTSYFRYQGAIVNEMRKRGIQVMLPNASRWISSRWRNEDIEIKTAFWQLAEIREAEDKGKTAGEKADMKRARRKRGNTDHVLDVLLEGSTNSEARQLADVISVWVDTIPSPSPQELEKQMVPVNMRRRKGGMKRGSHSSQGFPEVPHE